MKPHSVKDNIPNNGTKENISLPINQPTKNHPTKKYPNTSMKRKAEPEGRDPIYKKEKGPTLKNGSVQTAPMGINTIGSKGPSESLLAF